MTAIQTDHDPEPIGLVRSALTWLADRIVDMLYPITGSATIPLMLIATPMLVALCWCVAARRPRLVPLTSLGAVDRHVRSRRPRSVPMAVRRSVFGRVGS